MFPGNRWARLALATIVLAGACLRFWGVGKLSLSPDEAIFVYTASEPTLPKVWRASMVNVHPPGNFFLLHFLLKVSWNPVWLKMGSLVAGTAAVALMFWLGRELLGDAAGLSAAALAAFSPNLIELSRVARNYSPGMMFLLLSVIFCARYLRAERPRDAALFALFEFAAAAFHYSFIVVFLGLNAALALAGLARGRPARRHLMLAAAQAPVAALFLWAAFFHLPAMDARMVEGVFGYMRSEYSIPFPGVLYPLIQAERYLLGPGAVGQAFFYIGLAGAAALAVRRDWRPLAICLLPLPFAYLFALLGKLPLGATRHSAYLYPCLFLLVAAHARELAGFYAGLAEAWRAWRKNGPAGELAAGFIVRPAGTAALAALGFAFAGYSLSIYAQPMRAAEGDLPYYRAQSYRIVESPTLKADLDEVWSALKEMTSEEDLILLSYQPFLLLNYHLDPKPMTYAPRESRRFEHGGVRAYYSAAAGWGFVPKSFFAALADAEAEAPGRAWKRVIVPQAGWQVWGVKLDAQLAREFPGEDFGSDLGRATGDKVFAIDIERARALAARHRARAGAEPAAP